MAELADAHDLGSCALGVRVQISLRARQNSSIGESARFIPERLGVQVSFLVLDINYQINTKNYLQVIKFILY